MMISVVVVYNNERMFNDILRKSLANQTAEYELIALDNASGKFKSASEALNYGGKKATGKYIMFVHQDVELGSSSWLEQVETIMDGIPDLGIAGVAGASEVENSLEEKYLKHIHGYISNSGEMWGSKIEKEEVVQVLDEQLLIIPRKQFERMQFDEETFDHWHCYGADYCLSVKKFGLSAYVLPAFVYHRSSAININNILKYQKRLYNKHKRYNRCIYTTLGNISWKYLKRMTLIEMIRPTYFKLFPKWNTYLKRDLSDCNVVLDLGCGYKSPIQLCTVPLSVGVEFSGSNLEESAKRCIHSQYIKSRIEIINFKPESFDAVISIYSLDNLTEDERYKLVNKMERWAKKKIIIVTANGDLPEKEPHKNDRRLKIEELERMGFKIYGIYGWRRMWRDLEVDDYVPLAQRIIVDLTQKITYRHPKYALHLYAVKELEGSRA